jgi:hypothetical protein
MENKQSSASSQLCLSIFGLVLRKSLLMTAAISMLADVCDCKLQPRTGLCCVAPCIDLKRYTLYLFVFVFVILSM